VSSSAREQGNSVAGWINQGTRGKSHKRRETERQRKLSSPPCCMANNYTASEDFSHQCKDLTPGMVPEKSQKGFSLPSQPRPAPGRVYPDLCSARPRLVPPCPADQLRSQVGRLLQAQHLEQSPRLPSRQPHREGLLYPPRTSPLFVELYTGA